MRQGHVAELANLDRRDPIDGKSIVDRCHARRDRHDYFRRGVPGLRCQRLAAADLSVDREADRCQPLGHALDRDRERRFGNSRCAFAGGAFANGKKRAKWGGGLTDDRQVGRRSAVAQRFFERRGAVTAMVVLIDAGENAVAQADSIVAATASMANRGLNRMDLTRGDETLDIVRRIHIFSVRCSGVAVRRTLRSSREAGRLRRAGPLPGDQFEPNLSIGRLTALSFQDQRPSRLRMNVTSSSVPFRAVAVTVDQFL